MSDIPQTPLSSGSNAPSVIFADPEEAPGAPEPVAARNETVPAAPSASALTAEEFARAAEFAVTGGPRAYRAEPIAPAVPAASSAPQLTPEPAGIVPSAGAAAESQAEVATSPAVGASAAPVVSPVATTSLAPEVPSAPESSAPMQTPLVSLSDLDEEGLDETTQGEPMPATGHAAQVTFSVAPATESTEADPLAAPAPAVNPTAFADTPVLAATLASSPAGSAIPAAPVAPAIPATLDASADSKGRISGAHRAQTPESTTALPDPAAIADQSEAAMTAPATQAGQAGQPGSTTALTVPLGEPEEPTSDPAALDSAVARYTTSPSVTDLPTQAMPVVDTPGAATALLPVTAAPAPIPHAVRAPTASTPLALFPGEVAEGAVGLGLAVAPPGRENRGFAFFFAVIGTVVYGALTVLAVYGLLILNAHGTLIPAGQIDSTARSQIESFVQSWAFWFPLAIFGAVFIIAGLIINQGRWWGWVLSSVIAALFTGAASYAAQAIQNQLWNHGVHKAAHSLIVFAFTDPLYLWITFAEVLLAFMVVTWLGMAVAAHGQRVKRLNAEDRAEFERTVGASDTTTKETSAINSSVTANSSITA